MADLALKTMLHDRVRLIITVSGVAFAVTLVLVQVGLFIGLLDNAALTINHMSADIWVTSRNTPNIDFPSTFSETYVQRVRSVPGVARADNLILAFVNMSLPSGAKENVIVYALEDFSAWNLPWDVVEGNLADLRRGDYMFLDDAATRRFGAFAVGEYREILNYRVKLIGRTRNILSFTTTPLAFMNYFTAQAINPSQLRGKSTYILVRLAPGADPAAVRAEIRRRLPYNDVYTTADGAARSRDYWVKSTGLGLNMFVTVFLGCLVGVIVVTQTLYTSTMEHLKEFGTVKAIGGSNRDIYSILAKQALIAAVVGFVIGAAQSFAMRPLIGKINLKLIIDPQFTAIVFVGTVVMCLAAALVSFRKVAGIDPAMVFRT
jgi:putative ABC transport system permease protein